MPCFPALCFLVVMFINACDDKMILWHPLDESPCMPLHEFETRLLDM